MAVEVKKGGHQEYACTGCGKPIGKGKPHYRTGSGSFKRYHAECLPVKKAKEPKASAPAEKTAPE